MKTFTSIPRGSAASAGAKRSERGQTILIFAALFSVIMVIGAIAVDYGLWLSERRGVARASDLSALAASQDLPNKASADLPAVVARAKDFAHRNGYGEPDGATVQVTFWCGNNLNPPPAGICTNANRANWPFLTPNCTLWCDALNVFVQKPAVSLFSTFFGGVNFKVGYSSWGSVSFQSLPLDTALILDATGSQGSSPCKSGSDSTTPGCAIKESRDAANTFTNILLNNGQSTFQVGYSPFRDCYNPPRISGGGFATCIPDIASPLTPANCAAPPANSLEVCLTQNATTLHNKINATNAAGFTNICLGLLQGKSIVTGPGASIDPAARKFVVIQSDGQNTWNGSEGYNLAQGAPPVQCRPSSSPAAVPLCPVVPLTQCDPAGPSTDGIRRQEDLDLKALADSMKAQGIEIYVVGFGVAGTNNASQFPDASYCAQIGNANADPISDRRLLKCMASSTPGTNDHYYESPTASQLVATFQVVAFAIAGHGLTQLPPN